jgi:hypothetical protein
MIVNVEQCRRSDTFLLPYTLPLTLNTQQAQTVNATVNFELTKALRSASGGDGYDGYDEDLVDTPRSGDAAAAAAAAGNNSLDSSNSLFSDDPPLFSDDNSAGNSDAEEGSSMEYSASAGPARHAAMAASESSAAAAAVLELSSSEHDGDEADGAHAGAEEGSAPAVGGDWTKTVDTDISLPEDFEARADEHERAAQQTSPA